MELDTPISRQQAEAAFEEAVAAFGAFRDTWPEQSDEELLESANGVFTACLDEYVQNGARYTYIATMDPFMKWSTFLEALTDEEAKLLVNAGLPPETKEYVRNTEEPLRYLRNHLRHKPPEQERVVRLLLAGDFPSRLDDDVEWQEVIRSVLDDFPDEGAQLKRSIEQKLPSDG